MPVIYAVYTISAHSSATVDTLDLRHKETFI